MGMPALHAVCVALPAGFAPGPFLGSAGCLGVVTAVAAVGFFLYGRWLCRVDDADRARSLLDRACRVGFPLAYLLAIAAMAAVGWFEALNEFADSLPGGHTGIGATATTVASLLVPVVAPLGAAAGALPATVTLHDREAGAVVRGLLRSVAGVAAAATALVLAVTAANPDTATGLSWAGTALFVGVLVGAGWPRLLGLLASVREPTAAERERIARCREAIDLSVVDVRVVESSECDRARVVLRGLLGRRHLFVTDRLLADLDDDAVRACLALEAERARRLHLELRALAVGGTVVSAAAVGVGRFQIPGVSPTVGAAGVVLVGLAGLRAGQRLVYHADDAAVERTSHESVLTTLRSVTELDAAPTVGWLTALRRMEPPVGRRIDRLRRQAVEAKANEGGTDEAD